MSEASFTPPSPGSFPETLDSAILRLLMDSVPDRIYFKDLQSRFVRNNAAHARSLGADSPDDCVGKSDADFFSAEHAAIAFADEQRIIQSGQPIIAKIERLTMRDGQHGWASSTKMPWRDAQGRIIGTFGLTRDVTATKEAEDRLLEERNLLRTIIDHLPSRIFVKDKEARFLLNNKGHLEMLGAGDQAEATGKTTLDFFPGERGHQAVADDLQVIQGGPPIVNQEKSNFAEGGNIRWSLVTKVPLHDVHGQLTGLVGISHDITRRKQAEEELRRRTTEMETDLRMARQVQEAFITRTPPVFPRGVRPEASALHFSHRYIPATTLGGDFFDVVQLSDTKCGVLVCDVMGHGVRAGLLTALIRGIIGELGPRAADPSHVLAEINASLMPIVEQTGQPVFASAFFGVVDLAAGILSYGNAGHPPPLVRHARTKTIERLVPSDPEPATGLLGEFVYSRNECPFLPGDLFLGYTDGILEAANDEGGMFGEEGLRAVLAASVDLNGAGLCDGLLRSVERHSGHKIFEDDVCLVVIQGART